MKDEHRMRLETNLIGTKLLHGIDIFDGQFNTFDLGVETNACVLEINFGPFSDVRKSTLAASLTLGVGASLGRDEGVVETLSFNSDELFILALEFGAEEAESKVEGGGQHSVLRLGTEDGEGVGSSEVAEEETVLDPHGNTKIDWKIGERRR